jgi:hypothetical protein
MAHVAVKAGEKRCEARFVVGHGGSLHVDEAENLRSRAATDRRTASEVSLSSLEENASKRGVFIESRFFRVLDGRQSELIGSAKVGLAFGCVSHSFRI